MKILYVITKGTWGGAQRYVFDLACAAKKKGYEVAVAYGVPGELVSRLRIENIRTLLVPALGRDVSSADFSAYWQLKRTILRERPNILHLNSSKAGAFGALGGRLSRVPRIIFTAHGWALNEDRPFWQKIPIALAYYATALCSQKIIAVSEAVLGDMRFMPFVSYKVVMIHNGIAAPEFVPLAQAREKLLPGYAESFWIGALSELHPTKRLTDAVEAFGQITGEFPKAILVIGGEGQERKKLESLIRRKNLATKVFLLGHIFQGQRYLRAFDIFMLPSRSEALSYSLTEAGFAGLPVIATRVGGIPEVIESGVNGLLVPAQNPAALAQALRTLLGDASKRETLGAALEMRVTQKFSLREMLGKTFELYERS